MKKVLLSCMAIAAGATIAMAQDGPVFPSSLDYTINGQKELAGVDVVITDNGYGPSMSVTGKSDAESIALTFALPEGWDGWIISADWADVSEQPIAKTRGEYDWQPLNFFLDNLNYQKGNTVTFLVEEEANYATLALYKGDQVFTTTLRIEYNVVPGGGDTPIVSDEPLIPESIGVTTYAEGLIVDQERDEDDGSIYIDVTGAIEEKEYEVILDVPEGWDGYVILPYSENITIGDAENNVPGPKKISATDHDWYPIEEALEEGYIKGNKLTLKSTGNWEMAFAFLYKGEQIDYNAYIGITARVCNLIENQEAYDATIAKLNTLQEKYEAAVAKIKETNPDFDLSMYEEIPSMIAETKQNAEQALNSANSQGMSFSNIFYGVVEEIECYVSMMLMEVDPAPEFPSSFDVTLSSTEGVELTTDDSQGVFIINVAGESEEKEITVTVAVPEGFDGFVHMSDLDMNPGIGGGPLTTRAEEAEWWPISMVLAEMGGEEGNTITFPTDGQLHAGQFLICKNGLVDVNNQINVEFEVEGPAAVPAPEFPDSYVITTFPIEGLEVTQVVDYGVYTIGISGEISTPTFDVVIDVPEGWDGFVSIPYEDNIVIGESSNAPRKVIAEEYYWLDLDEFVEEYGGVKGNKFTFTPNGEEQDVAIYLYKDGQVEMVNWIALETMVKVTANEELIAANQAAYEAVIAELDALQVKYEDAVAQIKETNPDFDFTEWEEIPNMIAMYKEAAAQALASANEEGEEFNFPFDSEEFESYIAAMIMSATPAPAIPESYVVTTSSPTVNIEPLIGEDFALYKFTGECAEDEFTITFEVPEGWDNFIAYSDTFNNNDIMPLKNVIKKAVPTEWWPIDDMLESDMILTNTLTFPADGEEYWGQLMLVKDGLADVMNTINLEVCVSKSDDGNAVVGINAAENATYYDVNGNKIAKPAKGVYVKIVDGKATKVVVK